MAQPQSLHPDIRAVDIVRLQLSDLPEAERKLVVRPPNADPEVKTPEYMWIIPESNDARLPFTEPVMVRQEYYNVITAILWSLYRQSQVDPLKEDFPPTQDEQMDVDSSAEEDVDSSTEEDVDSSAEEDVDSSAEEDVETPLRRCPRRRCCPRPLLRIPNNPPNISENATLPNPFKHPRHGHFYRRDSAVIITGSPGIGKTLLLSVIFHLRVAAGLPTVFMRSADYVLVYTGHPVQQLFVLRDLISIHLAVSEGAWILFDANKPSFIPPETVVRTGLFIVQAASPRVGRMDWAEKIVGPYQFCLMQPWTLEELFTASSLQTRSCSGKRMQAFFNKFGGSAWHVYRDSSDICSFELLVDAAARSLNRSLVHPVMTYPKPTVAVDHRVGHMLITALPLTDKDRTIFRMVSPTGYLEEKLLKRLDDSILVARRELYIINVCVKSPGCKATAADLLVKHHHGFVGLGGKWRLREFTKTEEDHSTSKTNLWRASKKDSNLFLLANRTMSISRADEAPAAAAAATDFQGLTMLNFPSDNLKELQLHHYYRPSDTNFPTFDSFYMDKNGHGIIFQATGDNKHSVKEGGREWLEERGITKFTYILVSCPKMGNPPSLSVPRDQEKKFDHFYHLVLDYPELRKLLW